MNSKIYFIRHGITEGNQKMWHYGSTDIPLCKEGREGIQALIDQGYYPEGDGADLYTSGMLRTEETFIMIYGNRERTIIPEFKEYDFGDFERLTHADLEDNPAYRAWAGDKTKLIAPPGGESKKDFGDRLRMGYEKLVDNHTKKETVSIVVCHGGVIASIFADLFKDEKKHFYQWVPEPGRGYVLLMDGSKPVGYEVL